MSGWTQAGSRAGGFGLGRIKGMCDEPSMRMTSEVALRGSAKLRPVSAGKSFRFMRQCPSSPTPAVPSHTLPLRPSGVIKLIALRLSQWARTCSQTVFEAFAFKGLEPGDPRTRAVPRLAHFEQYFCRLPDPLRANCTPHERHFFFMRCPADPIRERQNDFVGVRQVREPLKIFLG